MTNSLTKLHQAGLMLAIALTVSVASSPSFAFGSVAEGRQLCGGDAFRLCAGEIPNVNKIAACLVAKKDQVSAPCRAFIDKQIAARSGKVATND
jgi:hypothetical protein